MKEAVFYQALMSGNTMVDDQHKQLIDAINKLYRAIESGHGVEEAKKSKRIIVKAKTTDGHDYPLKYKVIDDNKILIKNMASRASSSSMSVSRGLYLGDVSSLVIL